MVGRLKSKVDMAELRQKYEHLGSYSAVAKWASESYGLHLTGSHVRYWLSTPEITEQKILLFDIETAPMEVYTWGLYNQNIGINQIKTDWYVLMWAAKWFGDNYVYFDALNQHPDYDGGDLNESLVVGTLWTLLDEADIVVAHNASNFDVKKINAKFIEYGFPQPSHYRIVDTLKIARGNFGFTSNKLDYIGDLLVDSNKNKTDFSLWLGCMEGDEDSWKEMIEYCIQDVILLEDVYEKIRAWDSCHPPVKLAPFYTCNVCGGEQLTYDGDYHTIASTFEIFRCEDCGHIQRSRQNVANDVEKSFRQGNVR